MMSKRSRGFHRNRRSRVTRPMRRRTLRSGRSRRTRPMRRRTQRSRRSRKTRPMRMRTQRSRRIRRTRPMRMRRSLLRWAKPMAEVGVAEIGNTAPWRRQSTAVLAQRETRLHWQALLQKVTLNSTKLDSTVKLYHILIYYTALH
jgi:hypothetical protein